MTSLSNASYGTIRKAKAANSPITRRRRFGRHTSVDAELLISGEYGPSLAAQKDTIWKTFRKAVDKVLPPNKRYFKEQRVYEGLDYEETEADIEMKAKREKTLRQHYQVLAIRWGVFFIIGRLNWIVC